VKTKLVGIALLGCLAGLGCDSDDGGTAHDGAPVDAADAGVDSEADLAGGADGGEADGGVVPPAGPLGAQLGWLLDLLNGPTAAITPSAVAPHFSAAFLKAVPATTLAATLADLATVDAPFTLRSTEPGSQGTLSAIVSSRRKLFFRILLAPNSEGTVLNGLLLQLAPEADPELQSFAGISARLSALAKTTAAYVAEVGDMGTTGCTTKYDLRADQPMPLGSLFKIYVLGAVAAKVASGAATWADTITVDEAFKSLPSGTLQNQPAGTKVSIEAAATAMISISDNTAADHLLHFATRAQVEAALTAMGHSKPALDIPFLSTRELFQLKISATPDERAAYLAATPEMRRQLLDQVYAARALPELAAVAAWTSPIAIDQLEWFATPSDVCRAYAALKASADGPTGAPLYGILAKNPGINIDPKQFSYAGFKGGSEPGVLTLSWLLHRRVDGAWVNVTLGVSDPVSTIDDTAAVYYGQALVQLAGR
jgi:beta-lactamase class A